MTANFMLRISDSGHSIRSAKEDEPEDAGEKKREAWIDNNRPEDLLFERKPGEDAIGNHREDDARKKAYQPRREEGTEDVESGRTPASGDCDRQQCRRQNRPAMKTVHRLTSLLLQRFALME